MPSCSIHYPLKNKQKKKTRKKRPLPLTPVQCPSQEGAIDLSSNQTSVWSINHRGALFPQLESIHAAAQFQRICFNSIQYTKNELCCPFWLKIKMADGIQFGRGKSTMKNMASLIIWEEFLNTKKRGGKNSTGSLFHLKQWLYHSTFYSSIGKNRIKHLGARCYRKTINDGLVRWDLTRRWLFSNNSTSWIVLFPSNHSNLSTRKCICWWKKDTSPFLFICSF